MYKPGEVTLQEVARSEAQWTGVAVVPAGSVFVNYPRWSDQVPVSVARLDPLAGPVPFPATSWNDWSPGADPARKWVCVQSVVTDDRGRLWVLDPANPRFEGVVAGGAKLVCFNPTTHGVIASYSFGPEIARKNSYLNDVRIDTRRNFAYITDSGEGALVVLNLKTGVARRVLESTPSVKPEKIDVIVSGKPWRMNGQKRDIAADGIALTPDGVWVYYHALTGRTLYRIRTQWLADDRIREAQLAKLAEKVQVGRPSDGLEADHFGHVYLTSIEDNSLTLVTPSLDKNHRSRFMQQTLVQDARLEWPDSLAWDSRGYLYVTTSRIAQKDETPGEFKVYRLISTRDRQR
jgi:sugar lactone lactonase YvrE